MRLAPLLTLLGGGVFLFSSCDINMTATSIPLPIRNAVLNLSQSNGTIVADAKGFEDANPQIAIRSPDAVANGVRFNQGSSAETITMPDPEFGDHMVINYKGKGSPSVRYLTFFNPTSLCYERTGSTVAMTTYPGEVEVSQIVDSSTFYTKMVWQTDPTGKVTLTRKRTGKSYAITAAAFIPGVQLQVAESFDPPLEVGERFTHTLAAAVGTANNQVRFYNQYGGRHDLGGTFEATLDLVAANYPKLTDGYVMSCWEAEFPGGGVRITEHPCYLGRRVRFNNRTGSMPAELTAATDYYIVRLDSTDPRLCYVSATPEGAEINVSTVVGNYQVYYYPDGRDSTMAGLNLRCLTGANAGEVRAMGAITSNVADTEWTINMEESFTSPIAQDDTFEIEAPDVSGAPVPFDKWAYFLPMCQLNGREQGLPAKSPVTITTGAGTTSFVAEDANFAFVGAVPFYDGCPVRIYPKVFNDNAGTPSSQTFPTGLVAGQTYYVINSNSSTGEFELSATYDGVAIDLTGTTGQVHWICFSETSQHLDNPAPPGFNYNNQKCVPDTYNPYRGASQALTPSQAQPKIAYHWGWAQRLAERLGEDVYVVDLAVGGSTLSEVTAPPSSGYSLGWFDQSAHTHWAPGLTSLRARFLAVLDAAELAAAREGVRLKFKGVCFPQGESDAVTLDRANRYQALLDGFKAFVRAELKRRELWDGEEDQLPFLQPRIRTSTTGSWPYSAQVNAAIDALAKADPWGRTWNTDAYTLIDNVHYDGASMDLLAKSAASNLFDFLDGDGGNVLRICKLALRQAGESSAVSSVFPPDAGSKEAELCNAFYPEAREHMLDRHAWDFVVRNELLVEAATNERPHDWNHAYELPLNFRGMIGLGEDEMSAFDSRAIKIKHSIEMTSAGRRVLYANHAPDLYARYKTKLVDPAMFDAAFVNSCAAYMAAMIIRTTMKGEEGIKAGDAMERRAYGLFRSAASVDANHTRDSSQTQQGGWRR